MWACDSKWTNQILSPGGLRNWDIENVLLHSKYLVSHVGLEDAVAVGEWMIKLRSWLEERRELNIGAEKQH